MNSSVRLGSVGGVEIGVHYSWLLVFLLVASTLAIGLFPQQYPGLGVATYWGMGFAASLLLFASVLVHELAHSFLARARGLSVGGITLFVFGGVSNISDEPRTPSDELMIAAAGPITSIVLGGIFWGLWFATGAGFSPAEGVLLYLAGINILLAVFNLIPGFPLDGGRVLRAILWWATNSLRKATRIAARVGQGVSLLFILGGLLLAFSGALISGIWLMLIGWFLNNAAEASYRQVEATEMLRGMTVREAMNPNPMTVEADVPLSEVVHDYLLQRAVRALPVVADGRLVGMATVNEIRSVPRGQWDETPVGFVMTRADDLQTVAPTDDLAKAVTVLARHDVNQLPVVANGRLVGLLSRGNVIRLMQLRDELGVSPPGAEERRAA